MKSLLLLATALGVLTNLAAAATPDSIYEVAAKDIDGKPVKRDVCGRLLKNIIDTHRAGDAIDHHLRMPRVFAEKVGIGVRTATADGRVFVVEEKQSH